MKAILSRPSYDSNGIQNGADWVTRLQNHLLDFLNSDRASNQTKLRMSDLIFAEKQYYVRFDLTGTGMGKVKILDESTKKSVGATNFNLGELPKYTNFAFNKIAIKYTDVASAGVAVKDLTGWASVRGNVDKSVANGEILINKSGAPVYENPIAPLLHDVAPTNGTISDTAYEIDQIITLRESELVTIEINQASANPNVGPGTHTYGIEVIFVGLECRLGAN